MDLPSSPSIAALRAALDAPEGTLIGDHHRVVVGRTQGMTHTVKFLSGAQPGTCIAFVFGLSNNPVYQAIALDFDGEVFAGRRFVEWMMRNGLKELEQTAAGSLVLYFSSSDWRHIGTVDTSDRVVSQWGTFAVYEHGFFEVPQGYGDTVRFFDKPAPEQSFSDFLDYARSEGVSDRDIEAIIAEVEQRDS
jgi:hypothetical protein